MQIVFHDDETGNEGTLYLCMGCNEAWSKPLCPSCNACTECCTCPDLFERADQARDARREDAKRVGDLIALVRNNP